MNVIVLAENPAHTLREQLRRLYVRRRLQALWIGANLSLLVLACAVVSLGPALLAVILGNEDHGWAWVLAAALGLAGFSIARRIWRPWHGVLLEMTGLLVEREVERDAQDAAPLTGMERDALDELIGEMEDLEKQMTQSAASGKFAGPDTPFRNRMHSIRARLSRRNISARTRLIDAVVIDAGQADPADVGLYAKVLFNLARDTAEASRRILNGRPVPAGARTWPDNYARGRLDDRINHGGGPVSLRELVQRGDWLDPV